MMVSIDCCAVVTHNDGPLLENLRAFQKSKMICPIFTADQVVGLKVTLANPPTKRKLKMAPETVVEEESNLKR